MEFVTELTNILIYLFGLSIILLLAVLGVHECWLKFDKMMKKQKLDDHFDTIVRQ